MRNRISELPDDILVNVLSLLTLKEAIRTDVLSKRWKNMWVYCPTLNFDYPEALYYDVLDTELRKVGKPEYVTWVDKVVNSHKAPAIDEFRMRANIDLIRGKNSSESIDNWFRFAMAKRVKILEIDLSPFKGRSRTCHTFPSLALCNSLTSLKLGCINIHDGILENILCHCQALEYLLVKQSDTLENLSVCGPSLKHLKIFCEFEMKQLEISAPKLETVCYRGPEINVQFKNTPKLVQVHIGGYYAEGLTNICSDLSSSLSQIKVFRIDCWKLKYEPYKELMLFTRLEKLDVDICPRFDSDLHHYILMILACSFLKYFKLRLWPFPPRISPESLESYSHCITREQKKWLVSFHHHLEILEILGFMGHPIDLEFAAYLMESAPSLNKIIADTRNALRKGSPEYFEDTEERRLARERAELLRANLKPSTKLEIV